MSAPRTPLIVTPHGCTVWCDVGDTEVDIELAHDASCLGCRADVQAVRETTSRLGMLKCDQN